MDLTTIGILIGFFLTGMATGIAIGEGMAHRRQLNRQAARLGYADMKSPITLTKDEVEDILNAEVLQ
jgi:predicted transporter